MNLSLKFVFDNHIEMSWIRQSVSQFELLYVWQTKERKFHKPQ